MQSEALALETRSPEQTMELAAASAEGWRLNDVLGLVGTLGAGKTCFVRGLARGLAVEDLHRVTSPTFVLLRAYEGRLTLYHFDAYRLGSGDEMAALGCDETFESGGMSVVEWADHVRECLPPERFSLHIRVAGATRRRFRLEAAGAGPQSRLEKFRELLAPWVCRTGRD